MSASPTSPTSPTEDYEEVSNLMNNLKNLYPLEDKLSENIIIIYLMLGGRFIPTEFLNELIIDFHNMPSAYKSAKKRKGARKIEQFKKMFLEKLTKAGITYGCSIDRMVEELKLLKKNLSIPMEQKNIIQLFLNQVKSNQTLPSFPSLTESTSQVIPEVTTKSDSPLKNEITSDDSLEVDMKETKVKKRKVTTLNNFFPGQVTPISNFSSDITTSPELINESSSSEIKVRMPGTKRFAVSSDEMEATKIKDLIPLDIDLSKVDDEDFNEEITQMTISNTMKIEEMLSEKFIIPNYIADRILNSEVMSQKEKNKIISGKTMTLGQIMKHDPELSDIIVLTEFTRDDIKQTLNGRNEVVNWTKREKSKAKSSDSSSESAIEEILDKTITQIEAVEVEKDESVTLTQDVIEQLIRGSIVSDMEVEDNKEIAIMEAASSFTRIFEDTSSPAMELDFDDFTSNVRVDSPILESSVKPMKLKPLLLESFKIQTEEKSQKDARETFEIQKEEMVKRNTRNKILTKMNFNEMMSSESVSTITPVKKEKRKLEITIPEITEDIFESKERGMITEEFIKRVVEEMAQDKSINSTIIWNTLSSTIPKMFETIKREPTTPIQMIKMSPKIAARTIGKVLKKGRNFLVPSLSDNNDTEEDSPTMRKLRIKSIKRKPRVNKAKKRESLRMMMERNIKTALYETDEGLSSDYFEEVDLTDDEMDIGEVDLKKIMKTSTFKHPIKMEDPAEDFTVDIMKLGKVKLNKPTFEDMDISDNTSIMSISSRRKNILNSEPLKKLSISEEEAPVASSSMKKLKTFEYQPVPDDYFLFTPARGPSS